MKTRPPKHKSLLHTLNRSIFLVHLCILAVSLFLCCTVLLSVSRTQYIKQSQASMDLLVLHLESLSENLIMIRNNLLLDDDFCDYLSANQNSSVYDTTLQTDVNKTLSSLLFSNHYIDSFTVYMGSGDVLNVSSSNRIRSPQSRTSMILQQQPQYQSVSKSQLTWGGICNYTTLLPSYYAAYYPNHEKKVVPLLLSLGNIPSYAEQSVLSVNIPVEYLQMIFEQNVPPGCFASLYAADGTLLFSGSDPYTALRRDSLITCDLSHADWTVQITIPFSVFFRNVSTLLVTSFAIFFCSSLLVTLLSSLIGHRLLNPFQDIVAQMDEIRSGNMEKRLSPQQYTELDNLTDHFNSLMDRVQHLIGVSQNYAEEKRVLEVQALQSQINPHFIYNSLTTIRWMASMARAENVCQALLALSNTLRPVFSDSSTFWSLKAEQTFLENYCAIMSYRFGYKTQLVFDIPEEFREALVPRFILQPIVENSLIHGLSTIHDESARSIRISAQHSLQYLELYVTDNGKGIPEEKRLQMNTSFEQSIPLNFTIGQGKHSIGLYNVNRRLQLQYNTECGLCFQDTDSGTVMRVRLLFQNPAKV